MSFTNQWLTFRFLLSELTTVSGSLLSSKKSPIQHNLNSHHSSGAPNEKILFETALNQSVRQFPQR